MNRAYSVLTVKSLDDDQRIIEGIASTPSTDNMGDVVDLEGMEVKTPLPLLYQHNSRQPIGTVTSARKVKGQLLISAKIAAAGVAPFIDEAWNLIKAGLVGGFSIGFKALEEAYDRETGGFHYLKTKVFEISAVTIPANSEATILTVKSADSLVLAASGNKSTGAVRLDTTSTLPGVSGQTKTRGRTEMKTFSEQITDAENKRAASVARMTDLMSKSHEEGRTLDQSEAQEYDGLDIEVKDIESHLVRLKAHQSRLASTMTPVPAAPTDPKNVDTANRGGVVVRSNANVPKGTGFSRWVLAQFYAKGDTDRAADFAKKAWPDMPEVEMVLRAQVLPGTTTGTTWAAPLVPAAQNMQGEFMDLLRPATLIGRIPGLRRVPANISVPTQTGGATFQWVGEGIAKPVSALAFSATTLRWAKASGICVLTKELVRYSSPDAEQIVRDSMVRDCSAFLDVQFITPTVAEVTNVSPAAITNGATTAAASGTTAAAFESDLSTAIATFVTANDDVSKLVILMSGAVALNVMKLRDALGNKIYPEMTLNGGTIMGLPVIVSQAVGARIVVLNPNDILFNDDGPIEIDASEQASIIMDDTPAASPQTASLVSLWQHNYVGIRVEKFTTWKRGRSTSVYYISNAVYSG